MTYTKIEKPLMHIIGIECRTSNASGQSFKDIPQHWERFYREDISSQIPHRISEDVVALYCDYVTDHTGAYSFVIGCPVSIAETVPEGMILKTIPSGNYALFQAIGDPSQSVVGTWQTIWNTDLSRTYSGDYEVYGTHSPEKVDIFVAVE